MRTTPPAEGTRPNYTPRPIVGAIWHLSDLHFDPSSLPGAPHVRSQPEHVPPHDYFAQNFFLDLYEFARVQPADVLVLSGDFINASAIKAAVDRELEEAGKPVGHPAPDISLIGKFRSLFGRRKLGVSHDLERLRATRTAELRKEGFTYAAKFARSLADALGIGAINGRVVVCPGNHDVDQDAASHDPARSADEFYEAAGEFFHSRMDAPFQVISEIGLTILSLDTAKLCHARFKEADTPSVSRDAPAFPLGHIKDLISKYGRGSPRPARIAQPGTLGVVVAHHPPALTPTRAAAVQQFDVAIAAAQAKQALHGEGFRLFISGHKHIPVIHEDTTYQAGHRPETLLVVGSPPLLESQGSPGFNIIRYAVSAESGEARVLIRPYAFEGRAPAPRSSGYLFTTGCPSRSAARVIRVTERINKHGDSRADVWFHEVPVPTHRSAPTGGWEKQDGRWVRQFNRAIEVPYRQAMGPEVRAVSAKADAVAVQVGGDSALGKRAFQIRVSVDDTPEVTHVSFAERTWTNTTYGVSLDHQRRLWGSPGVIPELTLGWENLTCVVRDPADRLEIVVAMPFALRDGYEVALRTYVETEPDGALRQVPELLDFCTYHIEQHPEAKRLQVSVDHPLVGVAYSIEWRLPPEHPSLAGLSREEHREYLKQFGEAERLRSYAHGSGYGGDRTFTPWVDDHMQYLINELVNCGATDQPDLEWCLFVPRGNLWSPDSSGPEGAPSHPVLVPVFSNFGHGDDRWNVTWPAGYGLAGRAYATNDVARYVAEEREQLRLLALASNRWADGATADPYASVGALPPHSVLYAIPVRHPRRVQGDIVWGVLCLGVFPPQAVLNLDVDMPISATAPGRRPQSADAGVMAAMTLLGEELWIRAGAGR